MFCAEDRIDKGFFSYEPGSQCGMIHNDHLGTPQKMTDSSGTVVWSADYKPFGEATITVSTITNNLRFPGQYFDAETGLLYNMNRVYNAPLGRYNEADRIGIDEGRNQLYIYAMNNPIRNTDPLGEKCTTASQLSKIPQNIRDKIPSAVIQTIQKPCWEQKIFCVKMKCCAGLDIDLSSGTYMICTECNF